MHVSCLDLLILLKSWGEQMAFRLFLEAAAGQAGWWDSRNAAAECGGGGSPQLAVPSSFGLPWGDSDSSRISKRT